MDFQYLDILLFCLFVCLFVVVVVVTLHDSQMFHFLCDVSVLTFCVS